MNVSGLGLVQIEPDEILDNKSELQRVYDSNLKERGFITALTPKETNKYFLIQYDRYLLLSVVYISNGCGVHMFLMGDECVSRILKNEDANWTQFDREDIHRSKDGIPQDIPLECLECAELLDNYNLNVFKNTDLTRIYDRCSLLVQAIARGIALVEGKHGAKLRLEKSAEEYARAFEECLRCKYIGQDNNDLESSKVMPNKISEISVEVAEAIKTAPELVTETPLYARLKAYSVTPEDENQIYNLLRVFKTGDLTYCWLNAESTVLIDTSDTSRTSRLAILYETNTTKKFGKPDDAERVHRFFNETGLSVLGCVNCKYLNKDWVSCEKEEDSIANIRGLVSNSRSVDMNYIYRIQASVECGKKAGIYVYIRDGNSPVYAFTAGAREHITSLDLGMTKKYLEGLKADKKVFGRLVEELDDWKAEHNLIPACSLCKKPLLISGKCKTVGCENYFAMD